MTRSHDAPQVEFEHQQHECHVLKGHNECAVLGDAETYPRVSNGLKKCLCFARRGRPGVLWTRNVLPGLSRHGTKVWCGDGRDFCFHALRSHSERNANVNESRVARSEWLEPTITPPVVLLQMMVIVLCSQLSTVSPLRSISGRVVTHQCA